MRDSSSVDSVPQVPWEDFFKHALIPMGVLTWIGDDGRFLEANAASAAELGKQVEEVRGRSALELGIPAPLVKNWGLSLEVAHQVGAPIDVRWQVATAQGMRSFTSRVLPLRDGKDLTDRFGYINHDWTGADRPQHDDAAERELIAGRLAIALAEDIEAPLNQLLALIGIASDEVGALAATNPELEMEECARVLAEATLLTRKAHLPARELKEFLRPFTSVPGPVDAGECVRSAMRLVRSEVKRTSQIRADLLPAVLVRADEPRLRHALVRVLLDTARGPGSQLVHAGDLCLSMSLDDRQLELVVTRTDRMASPAADIARWESLIREAGGTLRVEPHVGTGFRVRIGLPLLRLS